MEILRRYWYQIRAFLTELPATTRWLILSLLTVAGMVVLLLMLYAGKATMVPISQFAVDRQGDVVTKLKAAGIDVQLVNGQVVVPEARRLDALAILGQSQLLTGDFSSSLNELAKQSSLFDTSHDKEQSLLQAKMKMSSQVISKMAGVQSAQVMITQPSNQGFGSTHIRPAASVAVIMMPHRYVDKPLVEAIAGWVKGAVAEMEPQDIVVVDLNAGRQFTVKSPDQVAPDEQLDNIAKIEQYHRDKITEMLRYIPGVIVAVNVRTDPTIQSEVKTNQFDKPPITSEDTTDSTSSDAPASGALGVASNVGTNIPSGGSAGRTETKNTSRTAYGAPNQIMEKIAKMAGGMAQQVNVTINVPRSYIVGLFKQGKPADAKEPDDAALDAIYQKEKPNIERQVGPLVEGMEMKGHVEVSMVPDIGMMAAMHDMGQLAGAGGMAGMVMSADWLKPVGLGLLGVMSLALMFGMVRKATHQQKLPTIEELAGVPPTLAPSEDDLVGEAEEAEAGMAGVELNDEQIRSRKMAEQIGAMVKSNPSEAATLFHRWIRKDE